MNLTEFNAFDISEFHDVETEHSPRRPGRAEIEQAVRTLIAAAGDDPSRDGVRDTPARVARAYGEWFAGYRVDPKSFLSRVFEETEGYEETILLRDIPLVSTCEHHMAPITGKAVSYTHLTLPTNSRV